MDVEKILAKCGVEVVKQVQTPDGCGKVFYFRIAEDAGVFWKRCLEEFLIGRKATDCAADVSKQYFVTEGTDIVRFLWRIKLVAKSPEGIADGVADFGAAAVRARAAGTEVTSIALVGRETPVFDPANGKIKGIHKQGADPSHLFVPGGFR